MEKPILPVIAFKGRAGAGKSTAAKYFEMKGYIRTSFASPLKAMMRVLGLHDAELFGDKKEAPCAVLCGRTPREAMQLLGTEWGRALHPELWTTLWRRRAAELLLEGNAVVVDDCRFPNEAEVVRALGGVVIEVVPPAAIEDDPYGTLALIQVGIVGHASEAQDFDPDIIVVNDGKSLAGLHANLAEAVAVLSEDGYAEAA